MKKMGSICWFKKCLIGGSGVRANICLVSYSIIFCMEPEYIRQDISTTWEKLIKPTYRAHLFHQVSCTLRSCRLGCRSGAVETSACVVLGSIFGLTQFSAVKTKLCTQLSIQASLGVEQTWLKAYLLRQKDGLYMLVLLASPRWRWCPGEY